MTISVLCYCVILRWMTSEIKSLERHDYFLFKHYYQQCRDAVFFGRHHQTLTASADVSVILLSRPIGCGVRNYGDPVLSDFDNTDLITVLEIVNKVVDLTEKSTLLT